MERVDIIITGKQGFNPSSKEIKVATDKFLKRGGTVKKVVFSKKDIDKFKKVIGKNFLKHIRNVKL